MYYAIYKDIRDSAWKCLLDFKLDRLPIDILKITRAANIHVIRDSIVSDLLSGENGKAYYDGICWRIIYNDTAPVAERRFTIAHELGHIFLGHDLKYAKYVGTQEFIGKHKSEQQADMFALRLLCPACVLHSLNLNTPTEIATACKVPLDMAALRAARMRELNKRNKFLTSPLEKEVYRNFEVHLTDSLPPASPKSQRATQNTNS